MCSTVIDRVSGSRPDSNHTSSRAASRSRRPRAMLAAGLIAAAANFTQAQPFNVRAWYAEGQVFVVWQFPAPPAAPTDTVEVYSSAAAQVSTAAMSQEGRLFFPEYTGRRLTELAPNARLLVPTPGGGTYRLAPDEGAFAYTPHAAGNRFFAVVDTGATIVNAVNSAATAFAYDPVNDPVRPHWQFNDTTPGGFPSAAYVVWGDGRLDPNDARPDVPVFGNRNKNGVPHVFTITRPPAGLPATPVPCVLALHGGGDHYNLFRPGEPARANLTLGLSNGIVVSPDDSIYVRIESDLVIMTTGWFGYTTNLDPFNAAPRVAPPNSDVVINYVQRRVNWILDWLQGPGTPQPIDPDRVALIGHSNGARGASHLSRLTPRRFSAAVAYCYPGDFTMKGTEDNFLRGNWDQNLPTNLSVPGIGTLGVTDVFTPSTRISATERDWPVTRFYYGKRDVKGSATWTAVQRASVDAIEATRMGPMISWDEREHGVEYWGIENASPGPDIAQWIVPPAPIGGSKTLRPSAQYLADTYRASQSYPAFFNTDHDMILAGRQPDPGPGDPNLGDAWGTWSGFCEWDGATIVDTASSWACTAYLTGLSATPVDNAGVAEITTDLAPRKTAAFSPAAGTLVTWVARDAVTNAVRQTGTSIAESDGVVAVSDLRVPRDPARVRLTLCTQGSGTAPTIATQPVNASTCPGGSAVFGVAGAGAGPFAYRWQIEAAPSGSNDWADLADGTINGGNAVAAGTASPVLTITGIDMSAVARYRCIIINALACGSVISNPASLTVCYANCDCSTTPPVLNVNDFTCFLNRYAAGSPYANCDSSTTPPVLNVNDFTCFLNKFAAACP
ncbi:MAG: GC-type dockerin domain-anchored protein [Phycisphaerales bacterium]